jgi:hypothetical protein
MIYKSQEKKKELIRSLKTFIIKGLSKVERPTMLGLNNFKTCKVSSFISLEIFQCPSSSRRGGFSKVVSVRVYL